MNALENAFLHGEARADLGAALEHLRHFDPAELADDLALLEIMQQELNRMKDEARAEAES